MDESARTIDVMAIGQLFKTHHTSYPAISAETADLSGKSVLITGASMGIGREAARRFAVAGCSRIALAARSDLAAVAAEVKQAALGAGHPEPQVLALEVDVSSNESVARAAEAVRSGFGASLDVLINNAGYLENWVPVTEADPVEWWRSWEVNIRGVFLCCHHFLPLVVKSNTKTVVNVSSMGAHALSKGASAYQTARFALCRFTEFVDSEHWNQGLVAITINPGGVKTKLALRMPEENHGWLTDDVSLSADFLVWLAREKRDWLSGRFVSANWDVEELEAAKEDIIARNLFKFRMTV